jgi:hypothetical protein
VSFAQQQVYFQVSFERCTWEAPSLAGGLAFDSLLLLLMVVVAQLQQSSE